MKYIKSHGMVGAQDFTTFTLAGCNGYHCWFSVPSRLIANDYPPGRRHVAQTLRDARNEVRRMEREHPTAPAGDLVQEPKNV